MVDIPYVITCNGDDRFWIGDREESNLPFSIEFSRRRRQNSE